MKKFIDIKLFELILRVNELLIRTYCALILLDIIKCITHLVFEICQNNNFCHICIRIPLIHIRLYYKTKS